MTELGGMSYAIFLKSLVSVWKQ